MKVVVHYLRPPTAYYIDYLRPLLTADFPFHELENVVMSPAGLGHR
jgi:hypothetical protein